jgi:hypothetical protein
VRFRAQRGLAPGERLIQTRRRVGLDDLCAG